MKISTLPILVMVASVAIVTGLIIVSYPAFGQSANSIFSNIHNFTVSGDNNNFIINANHNTPNATNPQNNTNPFLKTGEAIKSLFNQSATAKPMLEDKGEDISASVNSSDIRLPSNDNNNNTDTIDPAPVNTMGGIQAVADYDKEKNCATNLSLRPNMEQYLTYFNCGHVTTYENGTTLREFSLIVEENHTLPITLKPNEIQFPSWTFNGTIPGPTMRMTEGDHIRVTVINKGTMPHTLHMHSIHSGAMDGVPYASGKSGNILPGESFTYDFIAAPFGVYPYHCHSDPINLHINRGLYGAMIIDPKEHRPIAHEMVMLLNGYDLAYNEPLPRMPTVDEANQLMEIEKAEVDDNETNTVVDDNTTGSMSGGNMSTSMPMSMMVPMHDHNHSHVNPASPNAVADKVKEEKTHNDNATGKEEKQVELPEEHDNAIYTANGIAFYYYQYPIQLKVNEPQRIYLVNMLDFEDNSYHMHGNVFGYIPSGTQMNATMVNDIVEFTQGDRGILEFTYKYPGLYMQHAHLDQIAARGWMSLFEVK